MRVAALVALALACGCVSRPIGDAGGDGDRGSSDAADSFGEDEAIGPGDDDGTPSNPYLDCRPGLYDGYGEDTLCNGKFGSYPPSDACGVCICSSDCNSDQDCPSAGTAAEPKCFAAGDGRACFLRCERDADCPDEMICLLDMRDNRVCHWPAWKPQCCGDDDC